MPSLKQLLGNSTSGDNHESPGVRFGLMFDPFAYLFGDKYRNLMTKIPDAANKGMFKLNEPVFKASRKYDPLRKAVPELDSGMRWVENKPASTTGLLFGGYAAGGGFAGGGAAAGGVGSAGGASLAVPEVAPAIGGVEAGLTGTGASLGSMTVTAAPGGGVVAPAVAGGAGAGGATAAQSDGYDWQRMAQQMRGQGGGQRQQQPEGPPPMMPTPPYQRPVARFAHRTPTRRDLLLDAIARLQRGGV